MGYLFGTLLQAGVPITLALESLENVTLFPGYKALYKHIRINVESGESIRKSFVSFKHINRYVPSSVQQLLYAGELSGNFSATLIKVGGLFNDKTETTTKNLATIIEPILLVIVALGVALVAVAVILPIYSLVGNF
jgi:type IV pilus assembly protein PilC